LDIALDRTAVENLIFLLRWAAWDPWNAPEMARLTMANREETVELIKRLYDEHYDAVFRYLYLSGSTMSDADEFIQEAFLRLFETLRDGGQIEKPRNWLLRVAHNLRHDENLARTLQYANNRNVHPRRSHRET
jgi:DNA-directed RNA polymerase specialized sigma24 family protein